MVSVISHYECQGLVKETFTSFVSSVTVPRLVPLLCCRGAASEFQNLKICFKLGNTARKRREFFKFVYGNYVLSLTRVFEWLKRFREGLGGLEDGPRCGQPSAAQISGTAAEVEFVATDRQTTLKVMVHKLCINGEAIRQIIHGRFGNEKNSGVLLFDHAVSKTTLKCGSKAWVCSA